MSNENWTKGKWESDGVFVESSNGTAIVTGVGLTDDSEVEANAHLIAAAPELYEALKEICERTAMNFDGCSDVRARANKVLAKARGECLQAE